jgi:hypothetical protein
MRCCWDRSNHTLGNQSRNEDTSLVAASLGLSSALISVLNHFDSASSNRINHAAQHTPCACPTVLSSMLECRCVQPVERMPQLMWLRRSDIKG